VAKIVPFTEARSTLSELLDEVTDRQEHVVITRNGRPAAVMLSNEEYESLAETLEVLEDRDTLRPCATARRTFRPVGCIPWTS
jgi:prevent-host-death family protein